MNRCFFYFRVSGQELFVMIEQASDLMVTIERGDDDVGVNLFDLLADQNGARVIGSGNRNSIPVGQGGLMKRSSNCGGVNQRVADIHLSIRGYGHADHHDDSDLKGPRKNKDLISIIKSKIFLKFFWKTDQLTIDFIFIIFFAICFTKCWRELA
jgi:hypothetical protein